MTGLRLETIDRLSALSRAEWDRCANPEGQPFNPFVSYDFLEALEASGSALPETGWGPTHALLKLDDVLIGCAPLYLKSHSQGEYVFDHSWAHAFERAGGHYYPKLQCAVPFTPATGPRLLAPDDGTRQALAKGIQQLCAHYGTSSAHITFMSDADRAAFEAQDYLIRTDQQFHWINRGYDSFEDFLGALSSRKRKQIRKERREACANGIAVECVTGAALGELHWDAFYAFYMDTGLRKWGSPYLTREFFSLVGERMADHVLLIIARREGRIIAGALNFIGSDALYGRNWGCIEQHKFLHFELCYYAAIEFAITRKLKRVEAGAQGAHKLARGYEPAITQSAHFIAHEGFREAVAEFLDRERAMVSEDQKLLAARTPFRKDRYTFDSPDGPDGAAAESEGDF